MIDLAAWETAAKYWWNGILSLNGAGYLGAANGRQSIVSPTLKAQASYSFTSFQGNGQAHKSSEISGVTGLLIPSVSEIIHLNVTFRVESYSQLPNKTALYYASRARARLKLPGPLGTFQAAGFAVNLVRDIQEIPTWGVDDRIFSSCAFEVQFGTLSVESVVDPSEEQDLIETVEYSGNVAVENLDVPVLGTATKA